MSEHKEPPIRKVTPAYLPKPTTAGERALHMKKLGEMATDLEVLVLPSWWVKEMNDFTERVVHELEHYVHD